MKYYPSVSILVSVYNTIKYLPLFFKSLESQTFKDFEVIFVDDLSTDGSYEYCLAKAENNSKYTVIRAEEKLFPDKARALGFKVALGKYIMYLDSDDEFSDNYVEELYKLCHENDLDFAVSSCQRINEKSVPTSKIEFLSKKTYPLMSPKQKRFLLKGRYGGWNRMARREFLIENGYDYSQAELPLFILQFYDKTKVGYVREGIYFYRERGDSISRKNVPDRLIDYNCLEPLAWFHKSEISEVCKKPFSVYLYRMILPYIFYKKYFRGKYDYKKEIRHVAKSLKYNFFRGIKYWFYFSKRDKFILFFFIIHFYKPVFYFIKKYRS